MSTLANSDLFIVQRPDGGDAGTYKIEWESILDNIAASPAVQFKGTANFTAPGDDFDSGTASALSKHAAGQCCEELGTLVGAGIFRGRLEDYQQEIYDRAMQKRKNMRSFECSGTVCS